MSTQYTAIAARVLATIKKKGAPVIFDVGGETFDGLTETWSGAAGSPVTGRAVQDEGDPDRYASLNLVLVNPVTLLVAGKDLGIELKPGMKFTWAGKPYTIKAAADIGPDGDPILWTIVGSR